MKFRRQSACPHCQFYCLLIIMFLNITEQVTVPLNSTRLLHVTDFKKNLMLLLLLVQRWQFLRDRLLSVFNFFELNVPPPKLKAAFYSHLNQLWNVECIHTLKCLYSETSQLQGWSWSLWRTTEGMIRRWLIRAIAHNSRVWWYLIRRKFLKWRGLIYLDPNVYWQPKVFILLNIFWIYWIVENVACISNNLVMCFPWNLALKRSYLRIEA